ILSERPSKKREDLAMNYDGGFDEALDVCLAVYVPAAPTLVFLEPSLPELADVVTQLRLERELHSSVLPVAASDPPEFAHCRHVAGPLGAVRDPLLAAGYLMLLDCFA